ncbi:MAG TPA: hypothetical protein VGB71_00675 [Flavisolibacter sp.]|jgi:hypothetical protein
MNIQEFKQLDYTGRMEATAQAICVAGRDENIFKVLLYQLNDFYVEVYYNKLYNYISEFVAFDSADKLDPYLDRIQLPAFSV